MPSLGKAKRMDRSCNMNCSMRYLRDSWSFSMTPNSYTLITLTFRYQSIRREAPLLNTTFRPKRKSMMKTSTLDKAGHSEYSFLSYYSCSGDIKKTSIISNGLYKCLDSFSSRKNTVSYSNSDQCLQSIPNRINKLHCSK